MKPVIKMLKQTLVGTGTLLVSGVLLIIFAAPVQNYFQATFTRKDIFLNAPTTNVNSKFNRRYKKNSVKFYKTTT